ncbi:MAG: DNA-binding response regulator [Flavobacteriaceae bacterium]|nr:DNA-binding response regulator [Flavobacteriaceae bacterium]
MGPREIKILLVDDEPDIIEILSFNLKQEGYNVFSASNGKEAIDKARKIKPHLIIMDVMMPVMNGIESCELIREDKTINDVVIMFLTARGEDFSQLAAFDAGADDYVTKPVKPKIFISKVKAMLRRKIESQKPRIEKLEYDDLLIDKSEYNVVANNKPFSLPRKEFELLFLLASNPGKVITREKILEDIWGLGVVVGERTIDVHIRKLREKIGDSFFKTVKGVGYKFVISS